MTDRTYDTIALEQAHEQLRQERETFDQKKSQDGQWFRLRLAMGWTAVVLLPAIMAISTWILLHPGSFSREVVTLAASAMLVDALGLVLSVWRLVVGVRGPSVLVPVTKAIRPGVRKSSS
jgi:ABC-type uncharacterized transport system permease subunit